MAAEEMSLGEQAKIELLSGQVEALRASKSVRRSYLYWTGMKAKGGMGGSPEEAHAMIHSLELDDPGNWRKIKPPLPPGVFD